MDKLVTTITIPTDYTINNLDLKSLRGTSALLETHRLLIAQAARRTNERIAELEEKERLARGPNPRGMSRLGV